MNQRDLDWLSGLLEGEGSFGARRAKALTPGRRDSVRVLVAMTDEDIIDRAHNLMGGTKDRFQGKGRDGRDTKMQYRVTVGSENAVMLMLELLPFMGERRSERIIENVSPWIERVWPHFNDLDIKDEVFV